MILDAKWGWQSHVLSAKIQLMATDNYYETLGISKDATDKDIKKAYRKLAKELHPDHNKSADAEKKFNEVREAYDVLSDSQKKSAYDKYGKAGVDGFANGGGSGGFSGFEGFSGGGGYGQTVDMGDLGDIFNSFFSGGFDDSMGSRRGGRQRNSQQGVDLNYSIRLSFLEAIKGGDYEISLGRDVSCEHCKGTGADKGNVVTCTTCGGQGRVRRMQNSFFGQMSVVTECPDCDGTGKKAEKKCTFCAGRGVNNEKAKVKLKVPAGAYDGMTLKFRHGGSFTKGSSTPGDLYIEVTVEADARFERKGNDIYSKILLTPATVVLGAEVEVETVFGNVTLKIPAGTQPNTVFRIKEKGSPIIGNEDAKGDHYVTAVVKIPTKLSKEDRQLWENLSENEN